MNCRAFVSVLLVSSMAAAQTPPITTVPEGEDKIVPIHEGEEAPYSGQLFDPPTALRWANWLQQYKLRLKLDVETEREKCRVKLVAKDKVLSLHIDMHDQLSEDYRKRILRLERRNVKLQEELNNRPFYKRAWFGYVMGVATSVAVGTTAVLLSRK